MASLGLARPKSAGSDTVNPSTLVVDVGAVPLPELPGPRRLELLEDRAQPGGGLQEA